MTAIPAKHYLVPALFLGVMLALMLGSAWNDSAIIDELAHIPAGYSYIYLRDYRLNPEHPPLMKDLAALGLLFEPDITFPTDTRAWRDDINGQWTQGAIFLYESGNDADRMIRLMRFPMMLLTIGFGLLLWTWTYRHFGHRVAFLALFLFAFSPTLIAHGRYVTTDIAAAFGFFIGIIAYLRFLTEQNWKNIALAGLAFGIAQLLKFSLILLLPVYGVLAVVWAISKIQLSPRERFALFLHTTGKTAAIVAIGILLIWIVYTYHVWHYPPEQQYRDAQFILTSFAIRSWVAFDLWLIEHPFTRALGQYFLGLFMVLQRAAGGNTQYFFGEVSAAGDWKYFPTLYLLKEPLTLHIFTAIALFVGIRRLLAAQRKSVRAVLSWIRDHFIEFASLVFIAIYWASSVSSSLNIGVRHVLPTFPFIFLLVSREIVSWLRPWRQENNINTWQEWLRRIWQMYAASIPRYLFATFLLLWQAIAVISTFPAYLSYFNEAAGGTSYGYLAAVDSNYDWGQDLKRLVSYVEENGIEKIRVDYFGGGSPRYYLGDKFEPWSSAKGYPPGGGWFAVSATFQMGAFGQPADNFERKPDDSYEWLVPFRPVARAGTSIFIYQLPAEEPR